MSSKVVKLLYTVPDEKATAEHLCDESRAEQERQYTERHKSRSRYRRDLDRLIHSTALRRLQGKTQLYPGVESDFFRNRLTHSLEVAQIAESIGAKIASEDFRLPIDPDILEFAGLAHDLGHPPFGHQGEAMLNLLMADHGGYEGNAQTLRLLTKIEKKGLGKSIDLENLINDDIDNRTGLNLTARSLAAILKYDKVIPSMQKKPYIPIEKGYYGIDKELVHWIKECVTGDKNFKKFKTIECQIMDLADDIAYSTYDLEDGLKAGFYTLLDVVFIEEHLAKRIADELNQKDEFRENKLTAIAVIQTLRSLFTDFLDASFLRNIRRSIMLPENSDKIDEMFNHYSTTQYHSAKSISDSGYERSHLTSKLVRKFLDGIDVKYNQEHPSQTQVYFNEETLQQVEVLKKFTYVSQINSPRLKIAEYRGKEIVKTIFTEIKENPGLMPVDCQELCTGASEAMKLRLICDYVSGMTDRYAIEFYGRLKSENPETIFKPI